MEERAERSVWTVAFTAIAIFGVVLFVAGMLNTPEVITVAIK
ncbi:MAG: hypothetical protein QM488_00485 [Rhizobiaceae bacterium]